MSSVNSPSPSVDGEQLRIIMRRVASPVVVVTTAIEDEMRGMTAGSFTSVSLDPPLVCFNVGEGARMHALLEKSSRFSVHILRFSQEYLSDHFARPDLSGEEQFATLPFVKTSHGIPAIQGTLGILHCKKFSAFPAGDHTIFIGLVEKTELEEEGNPLVYFDRSYAGLKPVAG